MPPLGLYLHVPFCASICHYCDFNRGLLDPDLKRRYVSAMLREIHDAAASRDVDTMYFGGGTPSLLDPPEIAALVGACREAFRVDALAEVTLEANPDTVTIDRLAAYRAAGVNRLSLGVQSFLDVELQRLGRRHDAARARAAVTEARQAGFDNVSLDLMIGLPSQTFGDLDASLAELIARAPEHASIYLLELYPNAPLNEAIARAGWTPVPADDAADMYLHAMGRLDAAGYRQYEISNVAKPGRESRHNVKYWSDEEWLGFGPGAHSTTDHVRWNNVSSTTEYIRRLDEGRSPVAGRRILTPREQLEEALFMEIRLADGVQLERVRQRYGVDVWREWGARLAPFAESGLLEHDHVRLRLTRQGMLLANEIMSTFLEAGSTVK
ncbi:MAG TPA: radical SAM family heme chaperone HemW [Vicinamibacterales bacterium]|jgi:oxygen-independent coproporphyrinogen-3 oxidase